jgi:signal transduction histidine kinase
VKTPSSLTASHASERLLLAVDTAQLASWELEPGGALQADRRCRELHGLAEEAPLELSTLLERIEPSHRANAEETITGAFQAKGPAGFDLEYPVTVPGGTRWLFTRAQVLRAESGPRLVAAVLDISGRHRQEDAARKQADLYQQMVGVVSHDLKNPVQVLIAGLALLDEAGSLDDRQKTVLRRLKSATHRASRLITDLLDFTRDRLGDGIPVVRRRIDLFDVIRDVVSSFAFARPDGKIDLERSGDTNAQLDPDRMEQLVTNLLDNAFEYAESEERIRVVLEGHEDTLELSVLAHGEPITRELLPRLFDPLSPAVRQRNRRRVGLGLYIVRAIAEAHGGTADVSSSRQETRFSVLLPKR